MKTYIKFFLLLLTVTLLHTTTVIVTALAENPTMEYKVKTASMDSEENSKDLKLDMFISYCSVNQILGENNFTSTIRTLALNVYVTSPFKPPRA